MLYDDNFVISLPRDDLFAAILKVVDVYFAESRTPEDAVEARSLVLALAESEDLRFPQHIENAPIHWRSTSRPETIRASLDEIQRFCRQRLQEQKIHNQTTAFAALLGTRFHYALSQADIERIRVLINELRDMIRANEQFKEEHRQRLLRRLEELQREVHRHVSSLDRFYGLVGTAPSTWR